MTSEERLHLSSLKSRDVRFCSKLPRRAHAVSCSRLLDVLVAKPSVGRLALLSQSASKSGQAFATGAWT
jgi:hypothetical protein